MFVFRIIIGHIATGTCIQLNLLFTTTVLTIDNPIIRLLCTLHTYSAAVHISIKVNVKTLKQHQK